MDADTGDTVQLSPSYDSTTFTCDNFVVEAHITIYYDESTSTNSDDTVTFNNYFEITSATVDFLYGSISGTSADALVRTQNRISVSYK